jgi:hypothetical protein
MTQALETQPGATSARLVRELIIGGGYYCFWVSAFNAAGESALVPAEGNI